MFVLFATTAWCSAVDPMIWEIQLQDQASTRKLELGTVPRAESALMLGLYAGAPISVEN